MAPKAPILPVIITVTGAYLAWFGVHYWRSDVKWPSDPIKDVLSGKALPEATRTDNVAPIYAGSVGRTIAEGAGVVTGSTIANDALKYRGAGYVWGGQADKVGNWDCSSFVSKVLGEDLGLPLPGGHWGDPGFPPHAHGPTTLNYMMFGTGINLNDVRAGDLIVSVEHIGIAISPTQMISAQSPSSGTNVAGFPDGFPSGPPVYRRVTT
jgi:cell wall-associated NlpC family hydrolase